MSDGMIEIATPEGTADAFAAHPDDGQRHPGVLLYMDAIGLRPVLFDMVRRLAAEGYYVVAPNVFYRRGPAPVVEIPDMTSPEGRASFFDDAVPILTEHTVDRARVDAGAYLDFLTDRPEVRPGPVGVVGYCMGGGLAMRTAAWHPETVAAAAGFHAGHLVADDADSPHRTAPQINAELLFGLAEHDDTMPPEAIAELTASLDAAGVRYRCEVYPDTVHGFTMADTSAFSPTGLKRHWDALLPFLSRTLA
ncbi:MAG: dienelactone hydrolase family protein [Stackebrandtia sp.]